MSKEINVESGEICLMNDKGHMAIIPRKRVAWVKKKLADGCHACLDAYIETLPNIGNNGK